MSRILFDAFDGAPVGELSASLDATVQDATQALLAGAPLLAATGGSGRSSCGIPEIAGAEWLSWSPAESP